MRWLADLCVRRPVFTWVLILSMVVLGIAGLTGMPVERFPDVEIPFVTVAVPAPGLSADQVEAEITTRIEDALGTVSGLDHLESVSQEGFAVVAANFVLEKRLATATNEVRDRVARLVNELPRVAGAPRIDTFNTNASPMLLIAIDGEGAGARSALELTELADTVVRRELQAVRGVGQIKLVGGELRALTIVLDPVRLSALDLTAQEVLRALGDENLEVPGGSMANGVDMLSVRLSAKAHSAAELEQVIVARRGTMNVLISDLGHVEDGSTIAGSRALLDGRPAIVLTLTKLRGENTVTVAAAVRARLKQIAKRLPPGVHARVIQDNSEDVRAALTSVTEHLVVGAILAAIVVLLFLRSWRATLIAFLAIPASVLGAVAAAAALDVTLNLMSLLGLTLSVGIVIDDAIVVLENIVRTMARTGRSARDAAADATGEIALAVLATTLSLAAVFLPVGTMGGIVGRYLEPFGLTMSVSIMLSMLVAFTLTPMLCARWLRDSDLAEHVSAARGEHASGLLERMYRRVLTFTIARRWLTWLVIAATLACIVPLARSLPGAFTPVEDLLRFSVFVKLPDRASVERTAQVAEQLAVRLRTMEHIAETLVMTVNNREATISVYLDQRGVQSAMVQRVREQVKGLVPPDVFTMVGPMDEFQPPGPDSATIQYVLSGPDAAELKGVAEQLLATAKSLPGTADVGFTSSTGKAELALRVDRDHASKLAVSHAEIGSALELADRGGVELTSIRDPHSSHEQSLKVRLRVASDTFGSAELARSLGVRSQHGEMMPLSSVATFEVGEGPGLIRRANRQRMVKLFMNATPGASESGIVNALEERLLEVDPQHRFRGELVGSAKEMQSAIREFTTAVVLAFAFMYLILAAQFESWIHPATILLSLPLTVPFGMLSLIAGSQSLNVFSSLGFLVLFGVVKKNSILQVDRIIQLRAQGYPRTEAVIEACLDRLRPVLMTTMAFVVGMLPAALSSGAGAGTNRAVSVGIVGGQSLSLALTLVATPVAYVTFDNLSVRFAKLMAKRREARLQTVPT